MSSLYGTQGQESEHSTSRLTLLRVGIRLALDTTENACLTNRTNSTAIGMPWIGYGAVCVSVRNKRLNHAVPSVSVSVSVPRLAAFCSCE